MSTSGPPGLQMVEQISELSPARENCCVKWLKVDNVHTNANDPTPRVTVEVRKTRYHVRLGAKGCVFDITYVNAANQTASLSGQPPYVRPGAMA